jgi:hypothetical protein
MVDGDRPVTGEPVTSGNARPVGSHILPSPPAFDPRWKVERASRAQIEKWARRAMGAASAVPPAEAAKAAFDGLAKVPPGELARVAGYLAAFTQHQPPAVTDRRRR